MQLTRFMRPLLWHKRLGRRTPPSRSNKARRHMLAPEGLRIEYLEDRTLLSFLPAIHSNAGPVPAGLALGDFRSVGKLDTVVANHSADKVSILLGNGDGSFRAPQQLDTGVGPEAVVVGDFRGFGNGRLDIATVNDNGTVSILLGNGNGTFAPHRDITVGGNLLTLTAADLRHSGRPDLVVTDWLNNSVTILLNIGGGDFSRGNTYAVGGNPQAVAVGDFNGDGTADLAVANQFDNSVSILLGNGDGTFQPAQATPAGGGPSGLAVADFNGDGKADLVVTDANDAAVSILLGNGDGTFAAPQSYHVGNRPGPVAVGYFNDDLIPDVAVANRSDNTVSVLLGNGDGTFASQTGQPYSVGTLPIGLAVGDVNGDGAYDLVTANTVDSNVSALRNDELPHPVRLTVSAPPRFTAGTAAAVTVRALSLFGNPTRAYTGQVLLTTTDPQVTQQTVTFTPGDNGVKTVPFTLRTYPAQRITVTDQSPLSLPGDTTPSLTVDPGPARSFEVTLSATEVIAGRPITATVTAHDAFDNVANGYVGWVRFRSPNDPRAALPLDYHFTAGDSGSHRFDYDNPIIFRTRGTQQQFFVTDTTDASITGRSPTVNVRADAAVALRLVLPNLIAGEVATAVVRAVDYFENTADSYRGRVHFTSSDSRAELPGDFTFDPQRDGGQRPFPISLFTLGNQWVAVEDSGLQQPRDRREGTVSAPVVVRFDISGIPSTVTVGELTNFTVTAVGASGQRARGYQGTVRLSSSPSVVDGYYTFTLDDRGAVSFSFAARQTGPHSLTVQDTASGVSTSAGFTASAQPGVLTQLTFWHDRWGACRGEQTWVQIAAVDYFGQAVSTYHVPVHLDVSGNISLTPDIRDFTFEPGQPAGRFVDFRFWGGEGTIQGFDTSRSWIGSASVVVFERPPELCGNGPTGGAPQPPLERDTSPKSTGAPSDFGRPTPALMMGFSRADDSSQEIPRFARPLLGSFFNPEGDGASQRLIPQINSAAALSLRSSGDGADIDDFWIHFPENDRAFRPWAWGTR